MEKRTNGNLAYHGSSPPDVDVCIVVPVTPASAGGKGTPTPPEGGGDPLGGALTVSVKARKVFQSANKAVFPRYGGWTTYGQAVLQGSRGNLTFSS